MFDPPCLDLVGLPLRPLTDSQLHVGLSSDREFGPRGKWSRLVELSDAMK